MAKGAKTSKQSTLQSVRRWRAQALDVVSRKRAQALDVVSRKGAQALDVVSRKDGGYIKGEYEGDLRKQEDEADRDVKDEADRDVKDEADRDVEDEADHLLLKREQERMDYWFKKTGSSNVETFTGLALSGGGIRSAIFSLGVLQVLARENILERFDYLSTVSGGGYIGTSLTWWLRGKTGGDQTYDLDTNSFPFGTTDPAVPDGSLPKLPLAHLRNNGNYLVPGAGVNYLSGVAIVLRAVLLNLLVWIPILAAIFAGIMWFGLRAEAFGKALPDIITNTPDIQTAFGAIFEKVLILICGDPPSGNHLIFFHYLIITGLLLIVLFVAACIAYAFFTLLTPYLDDSEGNDENLNKAQKESFKFPDNYIFGRFMRYACYLLFPTIIAVPIYFWGDELSKYETLGDLSYGDLLNLALAVTVIGVAVVLGLLLTFMYFWRVDYLPFVYGCRRFFERAFGNVLLIGLLLIAVGLLPELPKLIFDEDSNTPNPYGVVGVILGAASGVVGHLSSVSKKLGTLGPSIALPIGSVFLLVGITLLAYQMAGKWYLDKDWYWIIFMSAFLIAVSSGFLTNINYISPHQYYRDRLTEAFLPDIERVEKASPGSAKRAEGFLLSNAWDTDDPKGPYPIINTNLILAKSDTHKYRMRGGDNFILTPFYCGSNATGWASTCKFADGKLNLATAMAISGAAANPNTGVGGKGITRNRFVSTVMTLLNLRLGFWVHRPTDKRIAYKRPDHFSPGLKFAIPWWGHTEDEDFLELSDGGHFENLGVYELIRRGCVLIVVCDGGQDIKASYSDLITALRRVEQDFGVYVTFDKGDGLERMIARSAPSHYPKDAEYADHGYLTAQIHYQRYKTRGGPSKGTLIYLKTTMIRELGIKAKGYKGAQPNFPDQTTGDQFFDEEQFEAYREVGYRIAETMVNNKKLNLAKKLNKIKKRPA